MGKPMTLRPNAFCDECGMLVWTDLHGAERRRCWLCAQDALRVGPTNGASARIPHVGEGAK